MSRRVQTVLLIALVAVLVASLGLTARAFVEEGDPADAAAVAPPPLAPLPRIDPSSPSLSPGGRALLAGADLAQAPRYSVSAIADPGSGAVHGRFRARLPRPEDGTLELRMLPGLPAYDAELAVTEVTVDERPVEARLEAALLTLPVARRGANDIDVRLRFSYRVPLGASTVGRFLTQATIGVLARHHDELLLGHWFPLWIPPGADADAGLAGYGDIGNFAAGAITARLEVPAGFGVFAAGSTLEEHSDARSATVTSSGVGLRDLAAVVARDMQSAEVKVGEVTVRASARAGNDVTDAAADAAATLGALELAFGPYPWSELEEVAVPLGPQVGGMEWPGAIWIDGFGASRDGAVDLVVAHELGHQWWHALVGNDSIASPIVDEPLAQLSQCVASTFRGSGSTACQFGGAPTGRGRGCLDRATDEYRPGEYGDFVYGDAPFFYRELLNRMGVQEVLGALRGISGRYAFETLTPAVLRDELARAFPGREAEVTELWDRMIGAPGCEPIR
jgi:hypothetical protein